LNEKRDQEKLLMDELKHIIENNEFNLNKKFEKLIEKIEMSANQVTDQLSANISYLQSLSSDINALNKTFLKISHSLRSKLFRNYFIILFIINSFFE
jgi:hypothetical protein